MKKVLAALSMLVMGNVYAQDLSFGDVNYFIKKGQFNFTVESTVEARNSKFKTGGNTNTVDREGYYQRARLAFALTDTFNFFVAGGYNHDDRVKNESPLSEKYDRSGFTNPQFGVNFRAVNQSNAPVNVDVGAVASINVQDEKIGSASGRNSTRNGNAADGRNSLEANVRVGKKWNEANEWQLALGGIYNHEGDRTRKYVGGASQNFNMDSSIDAYLRASYQYRPVPELMFLIALQENRIASSKESNRTNTYKYDEHMDLDVIFNAKYLITETFILRAQLQKGNNPSYDYKLNGVTTEVKSRRENVYGLGFDFLF